MTDLAAVLSAFRAATQCDAAVWTRASDGKFVKDASTDGAPALSDFPALSDGIRQVDTGQERVLVAAVPDHVAPGWSSVRVVCHTPISTATCGSWCQW